MTEGPVEFVIPDAIPKPACLHPGRIAATRIKAGALGKGNPNLNRLAHSQKLHVAPHNQT